uniref:NAC domain-containing protein 29 n=1 Tax=Aegilops tauschii TaxID=37682 RepID=N1R0H2_AEGTA
MAAEEGDGEEDKAIVVGAGDTAEEEIVAGADEEEEMHGGWDGGGGGGDGMFRPPPGFRFMPTEDEMIRYYLLPKLQGRAYVPNNAIIEDSVYQCHPDGLTSKYMDRGQAGRSFYFLSPRERKYKNGVRPRRDTKDRLGRWKASTGKTDERGGGDVRKEERVAGDGTTKYCKSGLAYFYFRGRGEKEKKSGWLMQELTVPEYEIKLPEKGGPGGPTLDRYVMYKIYPAPVGRKKRNNDDEAGPSNAEAAESDDEGETAELPPMLSDKQAGKRPKQPETDEMLEKRVLEQKPGGIPLDAAAAAAAADGVDDAPAAAMDDGVHDAAAADFGGSNADCNPDAGGKAPQFSLDDFYASQAAEHYRRSRAVLPATSGSPGEAAPVKADGSPDSTVVSAVGSGDGNNANHDRAESAAVKASPGGSASAEDEITPNMVGLGDRCSIL